MGAQKFKNMAQAEHGVTLTLQQASHFRKKFFESYTGIKQFHAKFGAPGAEVFERVGQS
jgi:hypothetical protein